MGCTVAVARGNAVNRADAVGRADVARSSDTSCVWWRAGGALGAIAAYQPKDAASYATSKINLANPGTFDATDGVAADWSSSGWFFNGTTQYLQTGIAPLRTYTALIQFSGIAVTSARTFFGSYQDASTALLIQTNTTSIRTFNGGQIDNTPFTTSGNLGVAGKQPYRNGIAEALTIAAGGADPAIGLFIGCLNIGGTPAQFLAMTTTAFVIYNNTLTSSQMLAVALAMAAL